MTFALIASALVAVFGICWYAFVEGTRWSVRRWRRWQVQLMSERCAIETAPTYCGRNR